MTFVVTFDIETKISHPSFKASDVRAGQFNGDHHHYNLSK